MCMHFHISSGHPLAMAAGLATLEVYKEQQLFERANDLAPYFESLLHSLKDLPNVIDVRNCGMMGAIEMSPLPGAPAKRNMDVFDRCFDKGVFVRVSGPSIALSPPLTSEKKHLDFAVQVLAEAINESAAQLK